jgi:HPt (histidine-containing phosphotransfer) domain-containing protein
MAESFSPAIDPAVLATLRQLNEDGQPDVVKEVLGLFLIDAPARLQAIVAAVANGDARGLQRAAHTLKGASGTIGALALQRVCRGLEEMARQDALADARSALEEMHREFGRVKDEIDQLL